VTTAARWLPCASASFRSNPQAPHKRERLSEAVALDSEEGAVLIREHRTFTTRQRSLAAII
jgi:hypothetical protein